jgi:dsRNA-specific ribonuclease
MVVVSYLVDNAPQMPHGRMHLIKTAIVNANFLAHICLDTVLDYEVQDIRFEGGTTIKEICSKKQVSMGQLMRYQSSDVMTALNKCITRHDEIADEVHDRLRYGRYYPWVLLASLEPEKFLSDIVESIFGAILIDSQGDLEACTTAAKNLGISDYLRRIVADDIDLLHPRNKLGELAGSSTVKYEVKVQDDTKRYGCRVLVGGTEIARVCDGLSRDDAMTRAADAAIRLESWVINDPCGAIR